jgi:hypothetical protein
MYIPFGTDLHWYSRINYKDKAVLHMCGNKINTPLTSEDWDTPSLYMKP